MSLVQCVDLGIEFAGNHILKEVNCTIEHNSKIGLIGPNGCGKSTLIKMIMGALEPTEGQILKARKCRLAYLAQNAVLDPDIRMIDYIENARPDILNLKHKMESLSAALASRHDESTQAELNATIEAMHASGAFEQDNNVKYVLTSLGFPPSEWPKHIRHFSGGEQTRICLAALLLMDYDLLILDEPTNHLDIAMTRWLERFLWGNPRPYMVVSHDRVFLDNTVSSIYYIRDHTLKISKGNYSSYYEADQIAAMAQERQWERQQKFIDETKAFIRKNIAGQKTAMAKSRIKMLERMDIVQKPHKARDVKLRIEGTQRSGNDVFILKDLSFGIGEDRVLAERVSISAFWQDRIALIGPNGCGKTTLLKILRDDYEILSGEIKIGASLRIAYYDQHQSYLDESLTVMDTLWALVPNEPRGYVLSWLARFGFTGDNVDKLVGVLSGGEKSRLYLSVLIHEKPNLLIMDEPTTIWISQCATPVGGSLRISGDHHLRLSRSPFHQHLQISSGSSPAGWMETECIPALKNPLLAAMLKPPLNWPSANRSYPRHRLLPGKESARSIPGIWSKCTSRSRTRTLKFASTRIDWKPSTSSFPIPPPMPTRLKCCG